MTKIIISFAILLGMSFGLNAQNLFSSEIVISTEAEGTESVYASDLDGDGDIDVLSASFVDSKIAWYENDGNGNFGEQNIISNVAYMAYNVFAADLDQDNDIDVISASGNKISWYENDGNGNFGEQTTITTNVNEPTVYACDLDGDGDNDILLSSFYYGKIAWCQNDGNGNFEDKIIITSEASGAKSIYANDLDGDGDMDILSASYYDNKIAWYENDGSNNFGEQIIISTNANNATSVYAADLDGDGDIDVISASKDDNKIAWYENDGNGGFGNQITITTNAIGAYSVYTSDLDGDGDTDILSASKDDNKIAWYENDGNGNFGEQNIINSAASWTFSVYASDIDGDGNMDVLSASYLDKKIAWYRNTSNQFLQPTNQEDCPNSSVEFTIENPINIEVFQWQILNGSTYENLSDNDQYSGTTTQTLFVNNINPDMNNNQYRCVLTIDGNTVESDSAILTVLPIPITGEITGNLNPSPNETYDYTVPNPNNSTFEWTVEGGSIISGTENTKNILWGAEGYGSLTLIETATNGCSGLPVQLPITIDVEEIAAKYHIQVFPNPTTGKLQIQGDNIQKIEILTLDGKLIRKINSKGKDIKIDLSEEAKGVYFIQFTLEDEVFSRKLILR